MKTWTSAQLAGFLRSVEGDRLYALWRLLAMTGLRRGEAVGLRWRDVDLDAATLSVHRTIVQTEDGPAFDTPKTKHGKRQIALDASTIEALRAWFGIQTLERADWEHG